ncbi:MAG TPA: carboxypeptidase regulatory-like domain-containing protein [Terriglobales bacterium]|nr:carboxypeptidase regulatory-like domain-containing protein [Terriglobales bacterium]
MKRNLSLMMLLAILCAAWAITAVGQTGALGTVKGVCRDAEGNPIVDAQVVWHNDDNGRTYKLKTNKKGEYFSLGIEPGMYTVIVSKDGKQLFSEAKHQVQVEELTFDIDLKAQREQQVQDTAKQTGLTPEQIQQKLAEQKKAEAYNANVKQVNEKLKAATAALQAQPPNYDSAIASLNEATQMAPNEDLVWYRLGATYLDSTKAQTDPNEKTKRSTEAYNDLKKAIDLKKTSEPAEGAPPPKPEEAATDKVREAAYYDNFGAAAARLGKSDEAADAYKHAAELDPTHAANYYYNLGVVLHNTAKDAEGKKQAAAAFDKAIQADPNKAEAYYLKGTDLISLSTSDSSGKLNAPDGTAEAFQKYLQLQPNGPHAEEAKQMLTALNQSIETGYGKKAATKKK